MQSRQPLTTSGKSPGSDRDTGKVGLTPIMPQRLIPATSAFRRDLALQPQPRCFTMTSTA
jgi:hypothetical protein